MEPADPVLSLIISTRNRSSALARTLESLRMIRTSQPWELLIIDNGSSDDTQLTIKRFVATFFGAVQLVSEPKRGLANAHNAGFREAKSPICVFIDDDCYPSEDYLSAISVCFAEDPGIGFIGGRILPWSDDDCAVATQKSTKRVAFAPYSFIPTGVIHGANFACRRTAIEAAGGFDSRFGPELFSSMRKRSNFWREFPTPGGLVLMIQDPWSITITVGKMAGMSGGS